MRINEIAHSLAGAGGIYGFAGITCASAALSDAAERNLAGRAKPLDVERALNRLLERICPLKTGICRRRDVRRLMLFNRCRGGFIFVSGFDRVANSSPPGDRSCWTLPRHPAPHRLTPRGSTG
jgi:hypothetical protein